MIDYLVVCINKLKLNNHDVILTIDANKTFEYDKGGVTKLISMTKSVYPIIACSHGLKKISNTHQ